MAARVAASPRRPKELELMLHPNCTEDDWKRATRIRVWRAKLRVSQIDVAVAAGLSQPQLAMYESAARLMSDRTFETILSVLQGFEPRSPASSKVRAVRHNGRSG